MDVLIKGIKKLPEDGDYIHLIIQNGKVHTAISCGYLTTDKLNVGTVVALPPHGDLIERSPLVQKIKDEWQKIHEETGYDVKGIFWNKLVEIIESSEVVLEAST